LQFSCNSKFWIAASQSWKVRFSDNPERDGSPSTRYCLPDSYIMEISIESSDPVNACCRHSFSSDLGEKVSVFLGRLAITRPPALTILATIGKASIERMAEAEAEEEEGDEFSRRSSSSFSSANNRIHQVRGICFNSRNTLEYFGIRTLISLWWFTSR